MLVEIIGRNAPRGSNELNGIFKLAGKGWSAEIYFPSSLPRHGREIAEAPAKTRKRPAFAHEIGRRDAKAKGAWANPHPSRSAGVSHRGAA